MKNKKLVFAAAILAAAINVFAIATLIYFAVDVFALYTENQFTGRVRAFDIDYWNAVSGVAILVIPAKLAGSLVRKMKEKEISQRSEDLAAEFKKMLDAVDSDDLDSGSAQDGTVWDPPKKPPFFN